MQNYLTLQDALDSGQLSLRESRQAYFAYTIYTMTANLTTPACIARRVLFPRSWQCFCQLVHLILHASGRER